MSAPQPRSSTATRPGEFYRERLTPSVGMIAATAVFATGVAVCFLPLGWLAFWLALAVAGAISAALLMRAAVTVVVRDGREGPELVAGRAHIPCRFLGPARGFTGEAARQERGPNLNTAAYLVVRGWVSGVMRVEVDDASDPTPYWLISSRSPEKLAAAIEAGRARALS